ncbi:hypothetical protein K413DRAFT_4802 [Clostridium sp. ASBs410]|nr:hypothetical protein K413DRAFT_4802 [Clostridium sp. ASBs410]
MDKYRAVANTNEFGLIKGTKYIIENPMTGSVYVYSLTGKYLTCCRKDSFDSWKSVNQ